MAAPFQLRIKGSGQRSVYSEYKVKYSYMDVRRAANERGRQEDHSWSPEDLRYGAGPGRRACSRKKHGRLIDYSRLVYELFFRRELAIDEADAMERFIESLGMSGPDYRAYLEGDGLREYEAAQQESQQDQVFGVPICVFRARTILGK